QQTAEQAVLLLVPGPALAHRPGWSEPAPGADRFGAARRLLANVRQSEPPDLRPRPAAAGRLQQRHRRAGLLRREYHPGQPDRSDRTGVDESAPAAECDRSDRTTAIQPCVSNGPGLAAQRSGAPRRLERITADHVLLARSVRV